MAAKLSKLGPKTNLGVEATIMAIREVLMRYYKGSCNQVIGKSNVGTHQDFPRTTRRYQRADAEKNNRTHVLLGDWIIYTLETTPLKMKVYNGTLDRSKEFRAVKDGVSEFMERYLGSVEISQSSEGETGGERDGIIVRQNIPDMKEIQTKSGHRVENPWETTIMQPSVEWIETRTSLGTGLQFDPQVYREHAQVLRELIDSDTDLLF